MRVRADSVEEKTTLNPGTGDLVLIGATSGNRPFSVIGDGNSCYYRVDAPDGTTWEIGEGTYTLSTTTLTRDTRFINSLGNTALVDLIGVCTVYLTLLASEIAAAGGAPGGSNKSIQYNDAGNFGGIGPLTNGQIVIGSTAATSVAAALTQPAAGITITPGAGSITFALGNDLAALEGMSGTGLVARTASETYAQRTLTAPAAGISVSNGDGVSGNPTLALANDLAALEGLSSTGLAARTTTDTWAQRTITGTSNRITITNGDGVSGNPTIDVHTSYVGQNTITTLGTIGTGTWAGTTIAVDHGGTGQTSYTNGQLLIGNTSGNTLNKATLTAGSNITITNGGGSITIAAGSSVATTGMIHPGYITGRMYTIPVQGAFSTVSISTGSLFLYPLQIPYDYTFTGMQVATLTGGAGQTIRFGVFADSSGAPGALIFDSGDVANTAGAFRSVTGQSIAITAGIVWLAVETSGTTQFRGAPNAGPITGWMLGESTSGAGTNSCSGGTATHTYGAFPNPVTGFTYAESNVPLVWLIA